MSDVVRIDYTNWKGIRSIKRICPTGELKFAATEFHPEVQWLMPAYDLDKGELRTFAVKDIHSWQPETDPEIKDVNE